MQFDSDLLRRYGIGLFVKGGTCSDQQLMSLAQYSDMACAPAQSCLSFPRACLVRARNPESNAWTSEKDRDSSRGSLSGTGFQPVGLTGWMPAPLENDRTNLEHELSCHLFRNYQ
jgi:hypothetical protein